MHKLNVLFALSMASFSLLAQEPLYLQAEEWDRPRSGQTIVTNPLLRTLVSRHQSYDNSQIVITYSDTEEGLLWAEELKSWLTALGIGSAQIELQAGEIPGDRLALQLVKQP